MAEILSGGLNWGSTQQAIVTMDKEGHPLTCCNPVTGECLGGGGSSDFSTAEVTINDFTADSATERKYFPVVNDGFVYVTDLAPSGPFNTYPKTITVVLGNNGLLIENAELTELEGNITGDSDIGYTITGDCSFSIGGGPK